VRGGLGVVDGPLVGFNVEHGVQVVHPRDGRLRLRRDGASGAAFRLRLRHSSTCGVTVGFRNESAGDGGHLGASGVTPPPHGVGGGDRHKCKGVRDHLLVAEVEGGALDVEGAEGVQQELVPRCGLRRPVEVGLPMGETCLQQHTGGDSDGSW